MKKYLFFFLILSTTASAFQNEPDGFKGIKWGTHVSKAPGMKILSIGSMCEHLKRMEYVKEDEFLMFEDIPLTKVIYLFINNIFTEVTLLGKGFFNIQKAKDILFKKYGDGTLECNELYFRVVYKWLSSVTNIFLDVNSAEVLSDMTFKITLNSSRDNERIIKHLKEKHEDKNKGTEL